jgi:hypothetical protein
MTRSTSVQIYKNYLGRGVFVSRVQTEIFIHRIPDRRIFWDLLSG